MSEESHDEATPMRTDFELNEVMGLFDVPAFVRRGQDVEYALASLERRCRDRRSAMLDMVRMRLRQWAGAAVGPDDVRGTFRAPIVDLWRLSHADPPRWAASPGSSRSRRAVARDLVGSIERFNARWAEFVSKIDLQIVNGVIAGYNDYYVLEKECAMGSARLASRDFRPVAVKTQQAILVDHPLLPVPELAEA